MKNDLDLPLLPSAEQIRRREFATVRRGYDPDQVREYLQGVAGQVETLERELRGPRKETKAQGSATPGGPPAPPVTAGQVMTPATPAATTPAPTMPSPAAPAQDPYEVIAKRFAGVLATADKEATAALAEAKAEADRILQEARSEADRIKLDAQGRAEQAKQQGTDSLAEAKHEADRILGSLSERREALVTRCTTCSRSCSRSRRSSSRRWMPPGRPPRPKGTIRGPLPPTAGPPTMSSTRATRTCGRCPRARRWSTSPISPRSTSTSKKNLGATDPSASVGRRRRLRP